MYLLKYFFLPKDDTNWRFNKYKYIHHQDAFACVCYLFLITFFAPDSDFFSISLEFVIDLFPIGCSAIAIT